MGHFWRATKLSSFREKLHCLIEIKPERRDDYYREFRASNPSGQHGDEHQWFLDRLNHFAVWNGKKHADDLESFLAPPLSSQVDTVGTTYKKVDLPVHAVGGRFLTRETIVGLRDYVQWKRPETPIFDRVDIPIDIPTSDLEVHVALDLDLFAHMDIREDEIANLALEFRNRESARFEGKEVVLYPEIRIEEQYGRAPNDEGSNEMLLKVRRLWQRVSRIVGGSGGDQISIPTDNGAISLELPQRFLFYRLRWPSPHLGIEACIRWEKPIRGES